MIQQLLAVIVIAFFIIRLFQQRRNNSISKGEYLLWLVFWILTGLSVIFIKYIDRLVGFFGFSGSGIEVLLYLAVALMFYLFFRLRIKIERIEKELTKVVRAIAIDKKNKNK